MQKSVAEAVFLQPYQDQAKAFVLGQGSTAMPIFDASPLHRSASEQTYLACLEDVRRLGGGTGALHQAQQRLDVFVSQSEGSPLDTVLRLWRRSYGENYSPPAAHVIWEAGERLLSRQVPSFRIVRDYCVRFGVAAAWSDARRHHLDLESYIIGLQLHPSSHLAAQHLLSRAQYFLHPHDPNSLIALTLSTSAPPTVIEKWRESLGDPTTCRLRKALHQVTESYNVDDPPKFLRGPLLNRSFAAEGRANAASSDLDMIISDRWTEIWDSFLSSHGNELSQSDEPFLSERESDGGIVTDLFFRGRQRPIPSEHNAKMIFSQHAYNELSCFLSTDEGMQAIRLLAQSIDFSKQWRRDDLLPRITWMHHHIAYHGLLSFLIKESQKLFLHERLTYRGGGVHEPGTAAFLSSRSLSPGSVSTAMLPASPSPMLRSVFPACVERGGWEG